MDKKEEDQRMKELKDRYIRFDWAIKRLLRQKANFGVLEGFLTVFLGEKITIVELLESEGNQLSEDDKFNRVYAKALNDKGEIIIVKLRHRTGRGLPLSRAESFHRRTYQGSIGSQHEREERNCLQAIPRDFPRIYTHTDQ